MRLKTTFTALAALAATAVTTLHAGDTATALPWKPDGDLGVGLYARQSVVKGVSNEVTPIPYAYIDYGRLFCRVDTFGVKTIPMGDGYLECVGRVSSDGFSTDNKTLRGLNDRKDPMLLGLGTFQITDIGAFAVYGFHDVYHSHGNVAEVSYIAELPVGKAFTLYPSIGLDYYDSAYNRYYYGVTKAEAARSRFHAYTPSESVSPFVNVTADIPVWKQWHVSATLQETFLGHSVTRSPIVSRHCQTTCILALAYQFKAKE